MSTNPKELRRGIKYMFGALPFFILAPLVINIGYSAIKKDQNYVFIVIGAIAAVAGIAFIFMGIRIALNALFSKK